ncbi:hypothetical protein DL93DRAFT_2087269, partial [Clavulina sp. PMI_390]
FGQNRDELWAGFFIAMVDARVCWWRGLIVRGLLERFRSMRNNVEWAVSFGVGVLERTMDVESGARNEGGMREEDVAAAGERPNPKTKLERGTKPFWRRDDWEDREVWRTLESKNEIFCGGRSLWAFRRRKWIWRIEVVGGDSTARQCGEAHTNN